MELDASLGILGVIKSMWEIMYGHNQILDIKGLACARVAKNF
ncbi:hypothetical protein [Lactiplantibacillus pentosus]|jgi:hypothetical protein|nr:hypothetical protein SN13T_0304 [Lactiplantibacillus plantarum]